jgi:hypothetical protein
MNARVARRIRKLARTFDWSPREYRRHKREHGHVTLPNTGWRKFKRWWRNERKRRERASA